jgi:hypothetical protein
MTFAYPRCNHPIAGYAEPCEIEIEVKRLAMIAQSHFGIYENLGN